MKITIQDIEHSSQRYPTSGDWQEVGEELVIDVSKLPDRRYELLVAVHELIEAILCQHAEVSGQEVDRFDIEHLEADEPGDMLDAPYHQQHVRASDVEKQLAEWLDVDWNKYEKALHELYDQY